MAAPTSSEVYRAVKRLSAELELHGMLLAHDVALPSATRCIAGQSIRGSWWGHPAGALIYESLKHVEHDIARVKLVAQKSTLVHRRLWPQLAAVARSRQSWQTANLSDEERDLLARVEAEGPLRVDQQPLIGARKAADIAKALELRLLVYATSEHTEAGNHAKWLLPFAEWQRRAELSDSALPDVESALAALTAPVQSWVGDRLDGMLPWLPALAKKSKKRSPTRRQ